MSNGCTIALFFVTGKTVELYKSEFYNSTSNGTIRSVRGKTPGAFRGYGTFQWTAAVKGLTAAIVRAALVGRNEFIDPFISGTAGSLAASLDYALSKEPSWLSEMFGTTAAGRALAKRLFLVTNPNRKRPGPVTVVVNHNLIEAHGISIYVDGLRLLDVSALSALLKAIEQQHRESAAGNPAGRRNLKLVA